MKKKLFCFNLAEDVTLSGILPIKAKFGFTLAEVLITLGIIGVVAAMTIPNLINNYKAHRLRSQFLKSYSTVQQVLKQMEADDVSLDISTYKENASFYKAFMKYLQAPFDCGYAESIKNSPCYHYIPNGTDNAKPYVSLDGNSTVNGNWFDDGQIALQDGTLLLFENPKSFANNIWIAVDLNGYNNKPNKWGYDLFTFQFIDGELKTMGAQGTTYTDMSRYCNLETTNVMNGIACAQKAKEDSEYFKKLIKKVK